jgi:hypothetical protein
VNLGYAGEILAVSGTANAAEAQLDLKLKDRPVNLVAFAS